MTSFFENAFNRVANHAGLGPVGNGNSEVEMSNLPTSINDFKINGNQAEKEVTLSNGKKAMLVVVFPKGADASTIKKYLGVFDKPTTEATVRTAETLGLGRTTEAINGKKAKKAINAMHITIENGQMHFTKKYEDNTEKKVNAQSYGKSEDNGRRRKLKLNAIQNLQVLAQKRINELKL